MSPTALPLPQELYPAGYRALELDPAVHRETFLDLDSWAFAFESDPADAALPFPLEAGRTIGVVPEAGPTDPGGAPNLVAGHGSFAFTEFGVPGGTLPAAGLTYVAVHPQHRRRGIARAMVLTHLARTAARGEPLSVLWAAEPRIYGRFGYGSAARHVHVTVPRAAPLRAVPGTAGLSVHLERATPERHAQVVRSVQAAVARPGFARRQSEGHLALAVTDHRPWRRGKDGLRIAVVVDAAGAARGYATFRRKARWNEFGSPDGTVEVQEAVTLDGAAAHALWSAVLDLDLMNQVEAGNLALDDPLLTLLEDPRLARPRLADNVWVRPVDVPAALAGRRYAADVDVRLEVRDDLLPANAGTWRLVGGPDGAEVGAVRGAPDLSLTVADLGAAYLGGTSLAALGAAGLVAEHTPGALRTAATAFSWPVAPGTAWIF